MAIPEMLDNKDIFALCDYGRDSVAFKTVTAMDASSEICKLSSEYLGQPTLHKTFQEIDFVETFDGIWVCASLLHVPSYELADAIDKLAVSLKKDGVLFESFKYGTFEGDCNRRNFFDLNEETAKAYFNTSKLKIVKLWLTQNVRPDRNDEYWMNILACKLG